MSSRQFATLLTVFRSRSSAIERSLETIRSDFDRFMQIVPAVGNVTSQPVDAGGVDAEWLIPDDEGDGRVVIYFHGGGFGSGSLVSHRGLVSRLAAASGARVLSVGYRLAPEHPFPAAPEDCLRSYQWVIAGGAEVRSLAIGGDSAGGGLALTTLLDLRDSGAALPAAWFGLSPWTDLTGQAESITERAESDPILEVESLRRMTDLYLDGVADDHPQVSPLFADLRGLPPALIQVGTAEILHDDSTRLAANLRAAGSEVEIEIWEKMFHGWQLFGGMLPEADEAVARLAGWLAERL